MNRLSKKLFALVTAVCIVLACMAVPAFAAGTGLSADKPVYITKAEGNISATVAFENNGSAAASGKFILAQYEDGVLKDAKVSDVTVPAGGINSATVTATEIAGAEVKCFVLEKDNLRPLKAAVNTADGTAELTNILVDSTPLAGFSADKTTYSMAAASSKVPVVTGVPVNAESTVVTTSYSAGGGKSITATVTSKSTISEDEKAYKITFTLPADGEINPHVVKGATKDSDFVNGDDTTYTQYKVSDNKVADVHNGGDGIIYANFHGFVGADEETYTDTGSKGYIDTKFNDGYSVYTINEQILKGGYDYFNFKCNWQGNLAATDAYKDGYTGNVLEFTLDADATVAIVASSDIKFDTNGQGYKETVNSSGAVVLRQRNANGFTDRPYNYMYTKDFSAGDKVVIPYKADEIGTSRCPFIVLIPKSLVFDDTNAHSVITDFKNHINGLSYEEYCEYAGETVVSDEALKTGLSRSYYNVLTGTNFGVGSLVGSNNQRSVGFINPAFDLEGCEYVRFDNSYTFNRQNKEELNINWLVEAFIGIPTNGLTAGEEVEAKDNYGFTKTVPWASFKVTEDCDVIVIARGNIPVLEEKGYVKSQLSDTAIIVNRTNGEVANNYKTMYVKSFNAGDTVEMYNYRGGFNENVTLVRPK